MIRVFTIFCKLNFIKLSAKDLFLAAMFDFSSSNLPCPKCGAKHSKWSYFGSYKRYLISFEKGSIVEYEIDIDRLLCSSCKHTHAILPEIIIPYGSYSLLFILNVLRDYFFKTMKVQDICDKYHISVSTLYAWKKLFEIHKKLFLGFLEDACKSSGDFLSSMPAIKTSSDLFVFFKQQDYSFLQGVSKTALFNSG